MRPAGKRLLVACALAWIAGSSLADAPMSRSYVGTTQREMLLGPIVVCDAEGDGVGGACFDKLPPYAATVVIHDARLPAWAPVPLIMYAYDAYGWPTDGMVECPPNHGAVEFRYSRHAERAVIGVGAWALAGRACPFGGTHGTIEIGPLR